MYDNNNSHKLPCPFMWFSHRPVQNRTYSEVLDHFQDNFLQTRFTFLHFVQAKHSVSQSTTQAHKCKIEHIPNSSRLRFFDKTIDVHFVKQQRWVLYKWVLPSFRLKRKLILVVVEICRCLVFVQTDPLLSLFLVPNKMKMWQIREVLSSIFNHIEALIL